MAVSPERVDHAETLYRRVQIKHFDSRIHAQPSLQAFRPTEHDTHGLSLFRAKYMSPEQVAATGTSRHGYHVAAVHAGDLVQLGLTLRPDDDDFAHVAIPEMNAANRRHNNTLELTQRIADIAEIVLDRTPPDDAG